MKIKNIINLISIGSTFVALFGIMYIVINSIVTSILDLNSYQECNKPIIVKDVVISTVIIIFIIRFVKFYKPQNKNFE